MESHARLIDRSTLLSNFVHLPLRFHNWGNKVDPGSLARILVLSRLLLICYAHWVCDINWVLDGSCIVNFYKGEMRVIFRTPQISDGTSFLRAKEESVSSWLGLHIYTCITSPSSIFNPGKCCKQWPNCWSRKCRSRMSVSRFELLQTLQGHVIFLRNKWLAERLHLKLLMASTTTRHYFSMVNQFLSLSSSLILTEISDGLLIHSLSQNGPSARIWCICLQNKRLFWVWVFITGEDMKAFLRVENSKLTTGVRSVMSGILFFNNSVRGTGIAA